MWFMAECAPSEIKEWPTDKSNSASFSVELIITEEEHLTKCKKRKCVNAYFVSQLVPSTW